MSIATDLLSIAASKARIKADLVLKGFDSSAVTNLNSLVTMAFQDDLDAPDTPFIPDPSWPQDLHTWIPSGGIGFIMSNDSAGKVSFIVTTASAQYTVVVNDGTNDISTTNY